MIPQPELIANRFVMGELLGRGGMGEVYRGLDTQTQTPVAIKVLNPEYILQNPDAVERFNREGEALRLLNHPNIVKVLATSQEAYSHYIVMEMVSGGTLAELMRKQPHLPVTRVLAIALELADALTRAHHLRIIHRDLKPANVLLAEDGTPRLTDFGVAQIGTSQLTEAGATLGTIAYLSPEACRGEALDVRADIWAFGVMLYEMLTGRHPFQESQAAAMLYAIMTRPVPDIEELRPDVPVGMIDLIYRMLEKNPEARIPRMRMVGAELETIIDNLTTQIRPASLMRTSGRARFVTTFVDDTPTAMTPSQVVPPHHLPAFVTPLVGRDQELADLTALLNAPGARLVTLVGSGGMGKTRVAVAAAEMILESFPNGVFYVPLASVSDPEFIAPTIAEHLKFAFSGATELRSQLLDYLREKRLLLILDNIEHLIDHAGIIADILQAASAVKILAVSRERLRLQGEHILELGGLPLPEAGSTDELLAYPSMQLFIQSARRRLPDFVASGETIGQIAHICWLVEGMPLGIELAAAWLEALPVEEIVQQIAQSLDFLETDLRDIPERHRSLRAVFDSSWHLLNDEERDVLMKLSIFRGGFTREAAQKVANASLRTLTTLVNKSLSRRAADGRYSPHMTLRQYAAEQFESQVETKQAVRQAHATYYIEFLQKQAKLFNSRREKAAADEVEPEIENIRAAWHWVFANQRWSDLAELLQPLTAYYLLRSLLREGASIFGELADALEDNKAERFLYWRARFRQGWLAGRLGDYDLMYRLGDASLDYFRAINDKGESAYAFNNLSYACMMRGDYDDSRQYARQALVLAREANLKEVIALSIGNLGYAEYLAGNFDEARRLYEEFIDTAAKDGSPISHAYGLNNLGEILSARQERTAARTLYEEAYSIFKSYGHHQGMAFTLNNLAGIQFMLGNYHEAEQDFRECYNLYRDIGDRAGSGHSLSGVGNIALTAGKYAEAKRCYEESLALRRQLGDRRSIADSLNDLATVAHVEGKFAEARRLYEESLSIRHEIGDRFGGIFTWMGGGVAAGALGDYETAYRYFDEVMAAGKDLGQEALTAWAYSGIGEIQVLEGNYNAARAALQHALQIAIDVDDVFAILYTVANFAALLAATDAPDRALEIATLVVNYPLDMFTISKTKARRLTEQLRNRLAPAVFAEIQERGKSLAIEAVVQLLLQDRGT